MMTFSKYIKASLFLLSLVGIVIFVGSGRVEHTPLDVSEGLFDDSYVHELRLYIEDDNWFDSLYQNHSDEEDSYEYATLIHEDYEFYPVGVRFKGSSSFGYQSNKKSFKIDVNKFFENCTIYDALPECQDISFYGLTKFNLNNGFKDPSFLREKLFLDIAGNYLPTIRSIFVNVYVNDEHMGLYTGVEQVDDIFTTYNYGEGGNLFECEQISEEGGGQSTFGADLSYLGDDVQDYHNFYELKNTEKEDSWEGLLYFIDVLNNYDDDDFVREIETIADVDQFLAMIALNNIFANYDSYTGSAHNYYIYEDAQGIFHPIYWDTNESFGNFNIGAPSDQINADIFYGNHILEQRFFSIPEYRERYLEIVRDIAEKYLNPEWMAEAISSYANLIREHVYSDPLKVYSNEDFENALYYTDSALQVSASEQIQRGGPGGQGEATQALLQFAEGRYESILGQLEGY